MKLNNVTVNRVTSLLNNKIPDFLEGLAIANASFKEGDEVVLNYNVGYPECLRGHVGIISKPPYVVFGMKGEVQIDYHVFFPTATPSSVTFDNNSSISDYCIKESNLVRHITIAIDIRA